MKAFIISLAIVLFLFSGCAMGYRTTRNGAQLTLQPIYEPAE